MSAVPESERATRALLALAIGALAVWRGALGYARNYDPDEFQHLHVAYCALRGLVPYVDYYEHHAPGIAWLLAPVVAHFGETWDAVLASRAVMTACSVGILALVVALGRRVLDGTAAWLAALLLSGVPLFVDKALEVRPDVPATLLWLIGLLGLLSAFERGRRAPAFWGGLALGIGFMFTPKLAFGALGAGLAALALALGDEPVRRRARLGVLTAFTAAAWAPFAVVLGLLGLRGSAGAFVQHVVVEPLAWPRELSAWHFTASFVGTSPAFTALGVVGVLVLAGAPRWFGAAARGAAASADDSRRIVAGSALAFVVGWFTVPVPWPQFLLPLIPLLALGAAGVLAALARRSPAAWPALVCVALSAAFAVAWVRQVGLLGDRRLVVVYAALVAATAAPLFVAVPRARLALAAALAALVLPLGHIADRAHWRDFGVRLEFAHLMQHTDRDDTVLTGWSAPTMFRLHAYRYFFLHQGILAHLTPEQRGEDIVRLLSERPPRAVVRDLATRSLEPEVNAYLDAHYRASGIGDLWYR